MGAQVFTLCPQRQELDEDRSEDETRQAAEPADDDSDEQEDRERDRKRVRIDVRVRDREEGARDTRVGSADPEGERLVTSKAHPGRDRGRLAVADGAEGATGAAPQDQPGHGEGDERDRPGEVVEPVVEAQLPAEDGDSREAARQLRLSEEVDPRAAAREVREALDRGRHRDRDREGREGQVETGEPQGGKTEGETDEARDDPRDRNRPEVLDPAADRAAELLVPDHEDRGRVAADRHERSVPERDLTRIPREDVQAEERDQVDADVRVLLRLEVADESRQDRDEDDEGCERDEAEPAHRRVSGP